VVLLLVLAPVFGMGVLVVLCGVGFWFTARQQAGVAVERELAEVHNLDQVPETGAILMATFPKPKEGSGF